MVALDGVRGADRDSVAGAEDREVVFRDGPSLRSDRVLAGEDKRHRGVGGVPWQHELGAAREGPPALGLALGEPVDSASLALPRLLEVFSVWEHGLTDALLVRFGSDAATAPAALRRRASVTARAAMSAIRSSLQRYRAAHPRGGGSQAELAELLHDSFVLLTEGCPAS